MPYNFVSDSFHTKIPCIVNFLKAKYNFRRKSEICSFEPPLGELGTTYDDDL